MAEISESTRAMLRESAAGGARRRRRVRVVLAGVLVAAVAAGLTAWWLRPPPPPPLDADALVLARFAATDEFAALSDGRKLEYIERMIGAFPQLYQAVQDGKLSKAERERAMENAAPIYMRRQMDGYFQLPAGAQRDAYLDKIINQQEGMRLKIKLWPTSKPSTRPATQSSGPMRGDPGEFIKRFEKVAPDLRAQMAEFMKAMRDRRVARGLPAEPRRPF